jgi:transcriptional regulator with XRE-family HTH domain
MMRVMGHADVGTRIRLRRQELRMTQAELAERIGVHPATVRAWELNQNYPSRHQGALEAVLRMRLSGGQPEEDPDEQQLWALNLPPATIRKLVAAYRGEPASRRTA